MLRSTISFFNLVSNVVNIIIACMYSIPMETLFFSYVDDLLITRNNIDLILRLKK
jgi:hypothetical protein